MILMSACPNMQGSNESFITLELIDSKEWAPGKDKSWVSLIFGKNSLEALIPRCSATPIGDNVKSGVWIDFLGESHLKNLLLKNQTTSTNPT